MVATPATSRRIRRGEIYWVDFTPGRGSEQAGLRPALIIQNDVGNANSPNTIVAAVTSKIPSRAYPFHLRLPESTLPKPSIVMCEQLLTIDQSRLVGGPVAALGREMMREVDAGLVRSLGISAVAIL